MLQTSTGRIGWRSAPQRMPAVEVRLHHVVGPSTVAAGI
jgi:hypothetical protein